MINTLQVDGLVWITGYDKNHILSHRTASPHALYEVLGLDGGRGKTINDLVDRDYEILVNLAPSLGREVNPLGVCVTLFYY